MTVWKAGVLNALDHVGSIGSTSVVGTSWLMRMKSISTCRKPTVSKYRQGLNVGVFWIGYTDEIHFHIWMMAMSRWLKVRLCYYLVKVR